MPDSPTTLDAATGTPHSARTRAQTSTEATVVRIGKQAKSMARHLVSILRNDSRRLDMGLVAAGVAFFATLSIFPALAVFVMIWSLSADPAQIAALLEIGADILPPDVSRLLADRVTALVSAGSGMSWATILSGLFAFWTARAGVNAIARGLNAVYGSDRNQGFLSRELAITGLTLALYALAIVVAGALLIAPVVLSFLSLGVFGTIAAGLVRFLIAIAAVLVGLGLIYRYVPNLPDPPKVWITPGAIAATLLWLIGSLAFAIYLQNFANYDQVYGSIGAAAALMMWVYLSAYAVLLGGALNRVMVQDDANTLAPAPDAV